jgi:hypothetical protein
MATPQQSKQIYVELLPARIRGMVTEVLRHQQLLTAYHVGQLIMTYTGDEIRVELNRLGLNWKPTPPQQRY